MADSVVPTVNVSMMISMMPMTIIFMYPTTAASILNGFILSGSRLVDPSAEELSVSVLEVMNLIKKKERRETNHGPNQVKLLCAAPSCFILIIMSTS